MKTTYTNLSPTVVRELTNEFGEAFNTNQSGALLEALDTTVTSGVPNATTAQRGTVLRVAAPAAAPVPFADLTAAANYVNSLRTALITAGVLQ